MTYNVFERPMWLGREGQRERTCRIPKWIIDNVPDVDVIGFQEVFLEGCWDGKSSMREVLKYYGFPHSTETVDKDPSVLNGGSFIGVSTNVMIAHFTFISQHGQTT